MGKRSKWRKTISKAFEDFTDEEILKLTHEIVTEHTKIVKAEKKATKILDKYQFSTYSVNGTKEKLKRNYIIMSECINIRNLTIPEDWYEVEPTDKDVINILEHVKAIRMAWFHGEEDNELIKAEKNRIHLFFENIIKEEFGIVPKKEIEKEFVWEENIFNTDVRTLKKSRM